MEARHGPTSHANCRNQLAVRNTPQDLPEVSSGAQFLADLSNVKP